MSDNSQDELWPHFVPLWTDLRAIAPELLLAGGYGLFLKQQWLLSRLRVLRTGHSHSLPTDRRKKPIHEEVRTLVPLDGWSDQTSRVTKDLDFIANLDLIASKEEQQRLHEVLLKHAFSVVPKNARWQFEKKVSAGRSVILDFHAPSPAGKRDDLRVEERRVKPLRSLVKTGIHGRENPEAIGSELYPFCFTHEDAEIALPNSVTLALMKLVAMRDRRFASQDTSKSPGKRQKEERQAIKHAEDVCRVMAMMTREESEAAIAILDAVRSTTAFETATATFREFFGEEGWGSRVVAWKWQLEDLHLIRGALAAWFR